MSNQAAIMPKWETSSANSLGRVGLIVLLALAATIAGLVATTGRPLFVGVLTGLIIGCFLLARPKGAVTLILTVGLVMGALLSLAGPAFEKLSWVVSLLGFFLFIPALISARNLKHAPGFVYVSLSFLLLTLISTLIQWYSAGEVLAGIKRTFQASGLFFALALVPFTRKDFSRWRKIIFSIALLQIPFALYEFFILVPKRGGLAAGAQTTDVVAGTFGANIESGSPNSVMAFLLLTVLAFILAHWKEGLLRFRYVAVGLPLLMLPIALGEVKIVLVLLPIILFVLFKEEVFNRPKMFFGMSLIGVLVMTAIGTIYVQFIMKRPLADVIYNTLAYNIYDKGHGNYLLNRTTSLVFWWQQQGPHDPVGFFLGHGLGSSFESNRTFVVGHVAARWPSYGISLTDAAGLLWETGVVGTMLFILVFPSAWYACNRLKRELRTSYLKAEVSAIRATVPMLALFVIYNSSLTTLIAMEILASFVLGYLAHLYRVHDGETSESG